MDSKKDVIEKLLILGMLFVCVAFVWECPIQQILGIPCPGCNMTTALYYLLQGNVSSALFYHPLVLLMIVVIGIEILLYWKYRNFTNMYAKIFFYGFLGVLVVVYVYRMIYVYPQIPMVYVEDNLVSRIRTLFF